MNKFIFGLFFGFTAAIAHAAPAHLHGQAELTVVVDEGALSISLESPLDNLLGFERLPRNDAERQRVRAMAISLRAAANLFVSDVAAQCSLSSVSLHAALPPELLGNSVSPTTSTSTPSTNTEHAELVADYVFSCHTIGNLRQIEVGLFKVFPRLKRLVVQTAGPAGQTVQRLTPSASRVVLEP